MLSLGLRGLEFRLEDAGSRAYLRQSNRSSHVGKGIA